MTRSNTHSLNIPRVNKCYGIAVNEQMGLIYMVHKLASNNLKAKLQEKLIMKQKNEYTKQILSIMNVISL